MPKRTDIKKILILGSGPIVIGQACEFDYSGTQGCKALKEEGYEIVLLNSNPATIMTDPSMADVTYIEPMTLEVLESIIQKEKPDALLPTLGGQTALNLAIDLYKSGMLKKYNVEMIGAQYDVIHKAEDRKLFKEAVTKIGYGSARSDVAYTLEDAHKIADDVGFPCVVRPAFTLGGTGGGIAYNVEELDEIVGSGLRNSIISEVLIEESILGWKEYELEVMRDGNDNAIVVCSIENLDPMGVHTGDSITVAPAQTLTDREYQVLRDASIEILREIGVETGGANVQFAVDPKTGRVIVIEMNPRVSRSSALASKATGFPIAKFAAKLSVGYTLDELWNDITKKTPACFEPALDYCVIKIPRFNFDKFPASKPVLGTAMKSVGETMAIGRTFKEAFQKGLRSLEVKRFGFGYDGRCQDSISDDQLTEKLVVPNPERIFLLNIAFRRGFSLEKIFDLTGIDPWFLIQMEQIISFSSTIQTDKYSLMRAKQMGFSDVQLSHILGLSSEHDVRELRLKHNILPTYKLVDTCAAEFEAFTPYFYSTYEVEDESRVSDSKKVMILGSGPNRIGQGIEFDYCCVHCSFAVRDMGFESIMVNSNPETVSTDFDISDKLYFEPLTYEDVMNIYDREKPEGIIVQFGGQTPLNLANQLLERGATILGTSPKSIDLAEDREQFKQLLHQLGLRQPENRTVTDKKEAIDVANSIGYPVLIRPSFVLGGANMVIVYSDEELTDYLEEFNDFSIEAPLLIDQYLEQAIEVDVDGVADGVDCVVAGVMEHIEEAGVHSGDSACCLPPHSLSDDIITEIKQATHQLALALNVVGLLNIQFAVKDGKLYVIEVNPRGSRTVPFVSKATGVPWAKIATQVIMGKSLKDLKVSEPVLNYKAVKEAVFPFNKFPGTDILLGPQMKSTGEVMGIDPEFSHAFMKSQIAAGQKVPTEGTVFISVTNKDKPQALIVARRFVRLGFDIISTKGTAAYFNDHGVTASEVAKLGEGRPNVVDELINRRIKLVINTPVGRVPIQDEIKIRQQSIKLQVPVVTTMAGAEATIDAIEMGQEQQFQVSSIQALIGA